MPKFSKRKQQKPNHLSDDESLPPGSSRQRKSVKAVVADDNGNIIETQTRKTKVAKKLKSSSSNSKTSSKKAKESEKNGKMAEDLENGESSMKSSPSEDDNDDSRSSREEELKNPPEHKKSKSCFLSVDNKMAAVTEEESKKSPIQNGNMIKEVDLLEEDVSDGVSCDPGSDEDYSYTEMEDDNESTNTSRLFRGEDHDLSEDPFQEGAHFEVENGMFKCEFCGVLKTTDAELKAHLRTHTGERPFLCLVCNKAFNAKRTLLYHQFSVHGIEHKSVAARYPDIRKRKMEAGELVDESVIQEVDKKRRKFENEHGIGFVRDNLDNSLPFLVNGVVVENSKKRVCEICKKVCMKPSDLKRHMMSHTGERPFKCEVCGKPFRAKNSMMYHLKSAHGYMVELSPGLEERYLKLKKQSKIPSSTGKTSNGNSPYPSSQQFTTSNLSQEGTSNPAMFSTTSTKHSVAYPPIFNSLQLKNGEAQTYYSCDDRSFKNSDVQLDESSGLFKQKDVAFESVNPKIFSPKPSVNIPTLVKPGGNLVGKEIHQIFSTGSCDMKVDSETVLMTRLDGTLSSSGQKVCAYKCYLCGKLFNYLSKIQFHLSFHFEREIKTYHCKLCSASFSFQYQMHRHLHKCHTSVIANKGLSTSTSDPCSSHNLTSANSLAEHFSVLRFKRKDNGSYGCMICKKTFSKESSLLKHIKMHSNHDFCYCRNCGQGFSDYEFLREHFKQEHEEEIKSLESEKLVDGFNFKTEEASDTLLSHLLKKTSECGKETNKSEANGVREGHDVEERRAKEILKKEGIADEITVVLPCDPEDEQKAEELKSSLNDWQETEKDLCNSEIQTAPKMSLLAKVSSKSKRKASQPVRVNPLKEVKPVTEDNQEVVEETEKIPDEEFQPITNIKEEEDEEPVDKMNDFTSRSPSPAKSSASSDADYKLPTALPASGFWPSHLLPNAQFPQSMLATGQMLQAMAASGHVTNPSSLAQALSNPAAAQALFASGQMPTIAQALANASHIPASLAKTMTTSSSQSAFMPPNLASAAAFMHPSFPFSQIYALQAAAAAAALQQSKLNNNVSAANIKTEVNDKPQSESSNGHTVSRSLSPDVPLDLATTSSLNARSSNSPTTSSAGNVSDSSLRLPDDLSPNASFQEELAEDYRDGLVGMPKVQWSPGDGSPFTWHHMTTDGRKVTSLSRTHSRLPIVNSPVNRDQICKPTTLDDGRQVFSCPFCSKNFSSYSDINRHMDFHEDIRPYKCKYCEYFARTNSQLKVHMMRHQGIREFCCKVCNYKGVTQSDLNRHMKSQIHMLKSRNECSYCGEGFVTAKNLEKHLNGNCIVKVQQEKGEYLF